MDTVILYCDGLCEPNPGGPACYGWIARTAGGETLSQAYGVIGQGAGHTNNTAEYTAVLRALGWAYQAGHHVLVVRTDSKLVVNQAMGLWGCSDTLQPFLARVLGAKRVMAVRLEWIPREQNALADALSRRAYFEHTGKQPPARPPKRRTA